MTENSPTENKEPQSVEQIINTLDTEYEKRLDALKQELSNCFDIDPDRLEDENIRTISNLHLWLSRLAVEKQALKQLLRSRQLRYSQLHEEFRTGKRGAITLTDKGIDVWIQRDSRYQYLSSYCDQQEVLVDYINDICWALKNSKMTALKNLQDIKRLELG